jgi:RecB family exonuclease
MMADAIARDPDLSQAEVTEELTGMWTELGYEAKWLADSELKQALAALDRFRDWHESRADRRVVATEARFDEVVPIEGDRVRLTGAMDRVERDEQGKLHVVDLKTQRVAPTRRQVAEHRQLLLYQLAIDTSDEYTGQVAGAELVQLRVPGERPTVPKVQQQARVDPAEVKDELADAIRIIRSEDFRPSPSTQNCRTCPFVSVCPAQRDEE